jgi:nucleoside-diphosphate-sugar epimerase
LLERGFHVRALVRNPDNARELAAQGASIIKGDLQDTAALQRFVAGSDAIIHAAGVVRGASQADFDRVNVAGTAALLGAIKAQPHLPRLLLLSSLAAREPDLSWYAHSKRDSEKLLEQEPDLDWIIMRPPAVYGPGDKEMLPIFQWMGRGIAFVPGSAEARISLIHVADLVAAIMACLYSPGTRHQTLSLSDGKPGGYNWREMTSIAATTWGQRVRLWRVPAWLLDTVAQLNIRVAGITGGAPMLTPAKLRELRHRDWVVDNDAISAITEWTPTIALSEGLTEIKSSAL